MLISTVYLCLWCLLVEVFIGIQCDIKGHRGLGWYNRNAWWGANGQMRIGEKFLSSVANDWCNSTLRCACILLHPRGRENQVGFAQIKHLPNCWGGSFDFSLVSKVAEEENHVGASIGFALGGSIISTNLKHTHQTLSSVVFNVWTYSSKSILPLRFVSAVANIVLNSLREFFMREAYNVISVHGSSISGDKACW